MFGIEKFQALRAIDEVIRRLARHLDPNKGTLGSESVFLDGYCKENRLSEELLETPTATERVIGKEKTRRERGIDSEANGERPTQR